MMNSSKKIYPPKFVNVGTGKIINEDECVTIMAIFGILDM